MEKGKKGGRKGLVVFVKDLRGARCVAEKGIRKEKNGMERRREE